MSVNSRGKHPSMLVLVAMTLVAQLVAATACSPLARSARSKHQGEILGLNRQESTLTLRSVHRETTELAVFHVRPETVIREKGRDAVIRLEDLSPGDRVTVIGERIQGRRCAAEIIVRERRARPAP